MGIESQVQLSELSPSVQAALIQKLKTERINTPVTSLTIDAHGQVYLFGMETTFWVEYVRIKVALEDGTFDSGSIPVVRKRV